jgi:hypothetical protein
MTTGSAGEKRGTPTGKETVMCREIVTAVISQHRGSLHPSLERPPC